MKTPQITSNFPGTVQHSLPIWALRWELSGYKRANPNAIDPSALRGFSLPNVDEWADAWMLFRHLRETGLIQNCLNLRDARALMSDERFTQPPYTGKRTLIWKSVVRDATGRRNLFVPGIQNIRGQTPLIYWHWLEYKVNLKNCIGLIGQ